MLKRAFRTQRRTVGKTRIGPGNLDASTRIHTGYAWNETTQTQSEYGFSCRRTVNLTELPSVRMASPPPEVVRGYEFNLFYSNLIEGAKTPPYVNIKEPGNDETMVLQFTAGPPYEDAAFGVVNGDWEFSHK